MRILETHAFRVVMAAFEPSRELVQWVNGTKVVDEQGNPLRVFHGTPNPTFSGFKMDQTKNTAHEAANIGLWFVSDPISASNFATQDGTEYYQKATNDKPERVTDLARCKPRHFSGSG